MTYVMTPEQRARESVHRQSAAKRIVEDFVADNAAVLRQRPIPEQDMQMLMMRMHHTGRRLDRLKVGRR